MEYSDGWWLSHGRTWPLPTVADRQAEEKGDEHQWPEVQKSSLPRPSGRPLPSPPPNTLHRGRGFFFSAAEITPPFRVARPGSQPSVHWDDVIPGWIPSPASPTIPRCEWSIHELAPKCWLFRGPEAWASASRIGQIQLSAPTSSALGP
jgi:hypothetical protein